MSISQQYDRHILFAALALLMLGLVMVCSASITMAESKTGQPLYFFIRQLIYALMGLGLAAAVLSVRLFSWQQLAPQLLLFGIILLALVLIPGIGREVNGSARWLPLGPVNLQVAELIKLFAIIYIADYLQRHQGQISTAMAGILAPMVLLAIASFLLLLQPDMGSIVVILSTVVAMLFLGGARISIFVMMISVLGGLFYLLVTLAPYRLQRLQSFMDPWADPFGSGFQLTQALIAFGRGDWLGVGLGSSMQKLFYLPEAHTDFLYCQFRGTANGQRPPDQNKKQRNHHQCANQT